MGDLLTLNHNQIAQAIALTGHQETILVQGDMGSGKSSLLPLVQEYLKEYEPDTNFYVIYIDCTTKLDSADMFMIKYSEDGKSFHHVPHEELGLHLDGPCIIMFDEIGKCSRSYQLAVRRAMLERVAAGQKFHPKTRMFATTNLGLEGVGDTIPAHHLDSMTVVRLRKPNNIELVEYGRKHDVDGIILQCVYDHPQWSHSFTDYLGEGGEVTDDCPTAIFNPSAPQDKFVTPRGIMNCDVHVKNRHNLDDATLKVLLIGKIGREAGTILATYVQLHDKLVQDDEIKADPDNCRLPVNDDNSIHAGAACMVVYRILKNIEHSWSNEALTFIQRLPSTAQALFFNVVNNKDYEKASVVLGNEKYRKWCDANEHHLAPLFEPSSNPMGDALCK